MDLFKFQYNFVSTRLTLGDSLQSFKTKWKTWFCRTFCLSFIIYMTKNGIIIRKRRKERQRKVKGGGESRRRKRMPQVGGTRTTTSHPRWEKLSFPFSHRPNISIEIIEHRGQLPVREFTTETRCPRMCFPRLGTQWVQPKKRGTEAMGEWDREQNHAFMYLLSYREVL